jgi:hypothetical protein
MGRRTDFDNHRAQLWADRQIARLHLQFKFACSRLTLTNTEVDFGNPDPILGGGARFQFSHGWCGTLDL